MISHAYTYSYDVKGQTMNILQLEKQTDDY